VAIALPADPMSGGDDFTVEDWLSLPESRQRVELIDGSFVVSPLAATDHQVCAKRLVRVLDDAAPDDVEVIEGANVPCGEDGAIPDIVVGDADALLAHTTVLDPGFVLAVVEIVSPGKRNKKRDYTIKPRMYAAAGIPTFIRVEISGPGAPRVEVLSLEGGVYELVANACAGEVLTLKEPFKVSFDPAMLAGPKPRRS
jgi:Uma2 family endonuclease